MCTQVTKGIVVLVHVYTGHKGHCDVSTCVHRSHKALSLIVSVRSNMQKAPTHQMTSSHHTTPHHTTPHHPTSHHYTITPPRHTIPHHTTTPPHHTTTPSHHHITPLHHHTSPHYTTTSPQLATRPHHIPSHQLTTSYH